MKDINGIKIDVGDRVEVPDPDEFGDLWKLSFVGVVDDFHYGFEFIDVVDCEGKHFFVEPNRVEVRIN